MRCRNYASFELFELTCDQVTTTLRTFLARKKKQMIKSPHLKKVYAKLELAVKEKAKVCGVPNSGLFNNTRVNRNKERKNLPEKDVLDSG